MWGRRGGGHVIPRTFPEHLGALPMVTGHKHGKSIRCLCATDQQCRYSAIFFSRLKCSFFVCLFWSFFKPVMKYTPYIEKMAF
uniref:Uncharacterized protein n=1 Tax=Anguilla anguilla TaxID=7936 RepID=A0A0E9XNC8_ANGAN